MGQEWMILDKCCYNKEQKFSFDFLLTERF